jgi:DNA helicase-4
LGENLNLLITNTLRRSIAVADTLGQNMNMHDFSVTDLEQFADQLIENWPEAWLAPWNYSAISHVDKIKKTLGLGMALHPGEKEAISSLIGILGEEQFVQQLGDIVATSRIRIYSKLETRREKEAEEAAERERKRLEDIEKKRLIEIAEQKRIEESVALARLEKERMERERGKRLEELVLDTEDWFQTDYLSADNRFQSKYGSFNLESEYRHLRRSYLRGWFEANVSASQSEELKLADEQLDAIGEVHGNIQLVARAGSGKTSTVVYRAFFLIRNCRVKPSEILMLAFNRLASIEIRRRLLNLLYPEAENFLKTKIDEKRTTENKHKKRDRAAIEAEAIDEISSDLNLMLPFVLTFHALARAIVQPTGAILHDDDSNSDKTLSTFVQKLVDRTLDDKAKGQDIKSLLLAHFKNDWEKVVEGHYNLSKEEILEWRRSLPKQSIDGRYFKSTGEKLIADFLFENSVEYLYERNFWWAGQNYKPDFTILKSSKSGIVIEYFGMSGNLSYDRQKEEKLKFWSQKPGWSLVSLYPHELARGGVDGFKEILRTQLKSNGVEMIPLNENEIWQKIQEDGVLRYTQAITQFILRCRQLGWDTKALNDRVRRHDPLNDIESKFIKQASYFFGLYVDKVEQQGDTDFSKLLTDAALAISKGKHTFNRVPGNGDIRTLRYVFVDEFQDFSLAFDSLLRAILLVNPAIKLFCVGDDWQAINGFAGSDLQYFESFESTFPQSKVMKLSTNYRSDKYVVEFGNQIMRGQGAPAHAYHAHRNQVTVAYLDKMNPTHHELDIHGGDVVTPALLRLIQAQLVEGRDVVILSRTNTVPYYVSQSSSDFSSRKLEGYLTHLRSFFEEEIARKITISTSHRFKGREKTAVILLDAIERRYPFIHPDWVFSRILGSDLSSIMREERRLLYVAVTRAIDKLIILTDQKEVSPFLNLEANKALIQDIKWEKLDPPNAILRSVLVLVGKSTQSRGLGTFPIRDLLLSSGYEYFPGVWSHWRKAHVARTFAFEELRNEIWADENEATLRSGIELRLLVSPNTEFAKYQIDGNTWTPIFEKFELLETALEEES